MTKVKIRYIVGKRVERERLGVGSQVDVLGEFIVKLEEELKVKHEENRRLNRENIELEGKNRELTERLKEYEGL